VSSTACARAADRETEARRPPTLGRALRRLRAAGAPPRTGALLGLFGRLELLREHAPLLRALARRARRFTPRVADTVAALARSDPDAALETFLAAFECDYFELDESVCRQGFEIWAEAAPEFIPLPMRGHDRCNGLEPFGYRPGYTLLWALIQDVFWDDQRAQLIGEVSETFGSRLADRLASTDPPEHRVLSRRLARSPYAGMLAFSCWVLGDVANDLLFHHAHHAEEVQIPWTRRGVARAARLMRDAEIFEAPILALARWLEVAPRQHGRLLVDAVQGRPGASAWTRAAIRPCRRCGFPPAPRTWQEATSPELLSDPALHRARSTRPQVLPVHPEEEDIER
jgi:hypothetical protein